MDERWERIEAALDEALDLPPERLSAWLEGLDDDVRPEVERLVRAHQAAEGFLEAPAAADAAELVAGSAGSTGTGGATRIGPYRILGELGRGGMGEVYLAHREDLDLEVAVKRLPHAVTSRRAVEAFLAERRTLARLEHPNIARLLDAGLADEGRPYLVMERIDGRPLTRHCDAERLDVRARVRLFLDVCAAVGYAHGRLVVHRDLKPSNVLVTREGVPKLLDFGVAKVLDAAPRGRTRTVGHFMTPQYASPEQIRGDEIGVASDVYSLGAVLYELLSGRPPHEVPEGTPYEMGRAVLESEPLPLAEAADTDPGAEGVAAARSTPRRRLHQQLGGDLGTIVGRALHRDVGQRYPTPAALAEDLRRYLEGLPVLARGDSWSYRTGRFLRRNGWRVGLVGAALAALVTFGVFHNLRVAAERDRAQDQARTARSVSDFLISVFLESDPDRSDDHEATVQDVLARGSERVLADLEGDPLVRARLLDALGDVQAKLGRIREAEPLLKESLALRREHLEPDDPELLTSLGHLATLHSDLGEREECLALNREIYALAVKIHGEDHVQTVVRLHNLGTSLRAAGELEEAEEVLRRSLAGRRRHFGEEHVAVANAVGSLANLVRDRGRYEEAAELYAEALRLARIVHGEDHVRTASVWHHLGRMQVRTGRHEEAERSLGEALRIREAAYGEDSVRLEATLSTRGALRSDTGDLVGAEADYRRVLDLVARHVGPRSRRMVMTHTSLGRVLWFADRSPEADVSFREAIDIAAESYGEGHAAWVRAVEAYVEFLEYQERSGEAGTWRALAAESTDGS